MELLTALLKESNHNATSKALLSQNVELISQVVIRCVETADSWKNKKVSKTSQVIGLYVKMARALKGEGGKVSQEL